MFTLVIITYNEIGFYDKIPGPMINEALVTHFLMYVVTSWTEGCDYLEHNNPEGRIYSLSELPITLLPSSVFTFFFV